VTPRGLLLAVTALAVLWTAGIVVVPLTERSGDDVAATAAGLARLAYRPVCHQIPDRSLTLGGHPFAVCARCTGLYLGGVAGLALMALGRRRAPGRLWLLVAITPTVLDFGVGHLTGVGLPNLARLAVAFPAGLMLGWYLGIGVADLGRSRARRAGEAMSAQGPPTTSGRLHAEG
jgi:uncharacterized membrane protein